MATRETMDTVETQMEAVLEEKEMKEFKNESAFTRWFCRQLQVAGATTLAFVGSTMQQANVPDRYVCHPAFRGWLEMKKDGGKVKTGQRLLMERLLAGGDACLVVRLRGGMIEVESPDGRTLESVVVESLLALDGSADAARGIILLSLLKSARNR